ncbi:MAG: nucleoside monophosphate kinase [Mycoplasmoidaceae bacterium]|nr:nucleoside monophosphate kinase [Mycoplasmoidaceae bacterium]
MVLVLLGAPGSGKGTLSAKLKNELGYIHLSTGDLFRKIMKSDSPLGKKINEIIQSGKLVSDDLTNELVKQELSSIQNKNIVLDGYPRTVDQAKYLDSITKVDKAVLINVNNDIVIKRISGRRMCPKCNSIYNIYFMPPKSENVCDHDGTTLIQRKDDNIDSITKRLEVYEKQTKPLIDYYKHRQILVEFDGNNNQDQMFEAIKKF